MDLLAQINGKISTKARTYVTVILILVQPPLKIQAVQSQQCLDLGSNPTQKSQIQFYPLIIDLSGIVWVVVVVVFFQKCFSALKFQLALPEECLIQSQRAIIFLTSELLMIIIKRKDRSHVSLASVRTLECSLIQKHLCNQQATSNKLQNMSSPLFPIR